MNSIIEEKLKKGSIMKTVSIIAFVISFILYTNDSTRAVGMVLSMGSIVAGLVCSKKYRALKSSIKYLQKYNMQDLICDVDLSQFNLPLSKIYMGEKFFYANKPPVVIPYSMVAWVYAHETKYMGITVENSIVLCCRDGRTFQIKVNQNELPILLNEIQKFSQDLIVGYGKEQQKQYKRIQQNFLNQNRSVK